MIPFREEAIGCDESFRGNRNKTGITMLAGSDEFLKQLVQGLSACSVLGNAAKVEIRGFASSTDFKSYGESKSPNSDMCNLELANSRAEGVAARMIGKGGRSPAQAIVRKWDPKNQHDFLEMRSLAYFRDYKSGKNIEPNRGHLTRRVDIVITDAGDCEAPRD